MPFLNPSRWFRGDDETHVVRLTAHFFGRFFDNEFVSQSGESPLGVVHVLVLLGLPSVLYYFFLYPGYLRIAQARPDLYEPISMRDQFGYVCLSMLVIGLVATLEWDALFPDRLDFLTLTPLPVRARNFFLAKIAALLLFLFLFATAVGGPGMVLYPLAASSARHVTFFGLCRWMLSHGLTVAAASLFSFLFFVALEGVLLTVLSYRWFEKISPYIQGLLIAALMGLSLTTPELTENLPALLHTDHFFVRLFPPLWYLGLYKVLSGYSDPIYLSLARRALVSLGGIIGVCLITYPLSYRRHLKHILEAADVTPSEHWRLTRAVRKLADRVFLPDPLERAIFDFVFCALFGSRRHRLLLSAYTGVGAAIALESLTVFLSRGAAPSPARTAILLSVPLILCFFVLSGLRLVFEVPADVRANWIFKLTENTTSPGLLGGIRKAMIALGMFPLLSILFPILALHLGAWEACLALGLNVVFCLLLIEIVLVRFQKIPFTCSYNAGNSRSLALWLSCWVGFAGYAYTLANAENWALEDPVTAVALIASLSVAWKWLRIYNDGFQRRDIPLLFSDEPAPVVQTLDLSSCALTAAPLERPGGR